MKLAKKILVAVLALALLASCFISSAFAVDSAADNPFTAEGITKIDDILEYYSCDDYIAENYEKEEDAGYALEETYSASGSILTWADKSFEKKEATSSYNELPVITEVAANPTDENDKVLRVDLGYNDYIKYLRESEDANDLPQKVFFTFDIYFDETALGKSLFKVSVQTEGNNKISIIEFGFVKANASKGIEEAAVFSYAPWSEGAKNFDKSVVYEGFVPQANTWYSVSVCYNAEDEVCSFDVYNGNESVVSLSYAAPGATGIQLVECIAQLSNSDYRKISDAHAEMYIDDLEIYEGSYKRIPSEKESITRTTLLELEQLLLADTTSREDKLAVADVYNELLTMNDGEHASDVLAVVADAAKYVNSTYVDETVNRINAIDTSANYYTRCDYVNLTVAAYNDKLPAGEITELDGVTADKIAELNSARAALTAEISALETIKQHSEGFIAAINAYDSENKDYNQIIAYYTEASKDDYKLRSNDYEGVTEAEAIYEELTFKHNRMVKDAEEFIALVEEMAAQETLGALYPAYVEAKKAYYKYDEMPEFAEGAFINPDIDDSTNSALAEKKAYFESREEEIEQDIKDCDAFNLAVLMASSSDYYNTFVALINAADALYAVIEADFDSYLNDYPGLADGKTLVDTLALLNTLKASADEKMTATDAYIAAVAAIKQANGFYEKREAVDKALALKAAGDNLSVAGVKQANLDLTAAEAEVNQMQGNSESVIALVAQLQAADTIAERRQLVHEIEKHLGENNEKVAMDFTGVVSAIAAYTTEKAELAADIASVNAAINSAVKNTVAIA